MPIANFSLRRRKLLLTAAAAALSPSISRAASNEGKMELIVDHVMFPVYFNNAFMEIVGDVWKAMDSGEVFSADQNANFKGVYF